MTLSQMVNRHQSHSIAPDRSIGEIPNPIPLRIAKTPLSFGILRIEEISIEEISIS